MLVILGIIFGMALAIVLSYLKKTNFLMNLTNSGNVNIFVNSLVATGTILLATTTFITLFVNKIDYDKKQKTLLNQFNIEHLNDIKENCLRSILGEVIDQYYNYHFFELLDENKIPTIEYLRELISAPTHSWDEEIIFGSRYNEIISNKCFRDLENHKITNGIPADFEKVLKLINVNYPNYLNNFMILIKKIESKDSYIQIKKNVESSITTSDEVYGGKEQKLQTLNIYLKLIILISLDIQNIKYKFPNLFNVAYRNGVYEDLDKIGKEINNSEEIKAVLSVKNEVKQKVEMICERIKNIIDIDILLDECEYLKQKKAALSI